MLRLEGLLTAASNESAEDIGDREPDCAGRGSWALPLTRAREVDGAREGGKEFRSGIMKVAPVHPQAQQV